ncbi:MAG TPA: hypothetical protein PKA27_09540 [Fimbriimonadaceae bacterium]|nr:hypothetical protein [Fimbriimonadaceae bacterium]
MARVRGSWKPLLNVGLRLFSGEGIYPHLATFLQERRKQYEAKATRIGVFGGVVGSLAGGLCALIGILAGTRVLDIGMSGAVAWIIGNLAMAAGAIGYYAYLNNKNEREELAKNPLAREARETVKMLATLAQRRRLNTSLEKPVGLLLEEASRHWWRVMTTTDTPVWKDDNLADHWKAVRNQLRTAADQAMNEIILLLAHTVRTDGGGWQNVLESLLTEYLGHDRPSDFGPLPAGYVPAREIAEKLKLLAAETERLSAEALTSSTNRPLASGSAIDMCLGEIRSIQQAEAELHQTIGQGKQ